MPMETSQKKSITKTEGPLSDAKQTFRLQLIEKRKAISIKRRKEASEALFSVLAKQLAPFEQILSFVSFDEEIDTTFLNETLAYEGRLLLPKREEDHLVFYRVTDLKNGLEKKGARFFEPIPEKCERVSFEDFCVVLVPALGFDASRHRLGFGKGYYDRFLSNFSSAPYSIGVGFTEQFVEKLPTAPHDVALSSVHLF